MSPLKNNVEKFNNILIKIKKNAKMNNIMLMCAMSCQNENNKDNTATEDFF